MKICLGLKPLLPTGHKILSICGDHMKRNEARTVSGRIKAVIFDFDGTLAELHLDFSEMRAAIADLLDRYHLQPSEFEHLYLLEMIEAGERHLAECSVARGETFHKDAMVCIENMEIEAAVHSSLFTGVKDMLAEMRNQSIVTGIITRNCHRAVQTVFPDYGNYVDALISREMTQHVKPDPGHLEEMLSLLNIAADRALMVGDHPIDVQIGKDLGTFTAAVLTGTGKHADLRDSQPDFLLQNVLEIREIIAPLRPKS